MNIKLDELNKKIISHLQKGRKSYKEIADDLSIAENTVKSRVRKLEKDKVIDITTMLNPQALKDSQIVLVGIQVKDLSYVKTGEKLSKLKRVIHVCVVTGRYDFIILVHLDKKLGILEFLDQELSKVKGIIVSETFVVYKSFNLKIPYLLDDEENTETENKTGEAAEE
ncbi:MAG: Lrp/AsnC family transcriptional regulator [Spirochaetia bacterium]|jgi:Lrp/AsnC family transcriptional regulator for asnA, asnC and gidA|nr:Lrp/AsnC family transcriptional regulator [Spirochaetia bacterium]